MEKIIIKIQNLLDLANNNSNQNESYAAALTAQELMAKYNVHIESIEDTSEKLGKSMFDNSKISGNRKWRIYLASIIATNFRCKVYLSGEYIVFYGYENDANIAMDVFKMLVSVATKLSRKEYYDRKKQGYNTKGVMNAFLLGFCDGVKDVLDRQCSALMIIIPEKVEKEYANMTLGWKRRKNTIQYNTNKQVRDHGKEAGIQAISSRHLQMAQ